MKTWQCVGIGLVAALLCIAIWRPFFDEGTRIKGLSADSSGNVVFALGDNIYRKGNGKPNAVLVTKGTSPDIMDGTGDLAFVRDDCIWVRRNGGSEVRLARADSRFRYDQPVFFEFGSRLLFTRETGRRFLWGLAPLEDRKMDVYSMTYDGREAQRLTKLEADSIGLQSSGVGASGVEFSSFRPESYSTDVLKIDPKGPNEPKLIAAKSQRTLSTRHLTVRLLLQNDGHSFNFAEPLTGQQVPIRVPGGYSGAFVTTSQDDIIFLRRAGDKEVELIRYSTRPGAHGFSKPELVALN